MNKSDYNTKIHNLLSDNSTYIKLEKDPTNDINLQLKSILLLWKSKKIINFIRIICRHLWPISETSIGILVFFIKFVSKTQKMLLF